MRLRTTLYLASFFPIFIAALYVALILTFHVTASLRSAGSADIPSTGLIVLAIFSLVVGWCFYRAGLKVVKQIAMLEQMTERIRRGDLKTTTKLPDSKNEVAAVAEVVSQMVVELRGYVELIGAYEKIKRQHTAALETAERLRASAIQASGALERLARAEQGIATRLLDENLYLLSWLPPGTVHSFLHASAAPSGAAPGFALIPPEIRDVFQRLIASEAESAQADNAGAQAQTLKPISVAEALRDAVTLCRWRWDRERPQKPIAITIDEKQPKPPDIPAERRDLVQLFTMVLVNAAEAMPDAGAVAIEIRTDADGTLTISIRDNGLGMSDAVRTRCMRSFFSTKEGNLGIGLNMARHVVTRYGGRLGVIGERGAGTTVYVSFPRPPKPGADRADLLKRKGLKILLVDDDEPSREMLLAQLKKEGHQATGVEDGAAAILQLRHQRFDVVMTDLAMPIMSGTELAAAVKARYPETPVVLVSGAGEELESRNAMPEGIDVILSKPVLRQDLVLALARALERTQSVADPDPVSAAS